MFRITLLTLLLLSALLISCQKDNKADARHTLAGTGHAVQLEYATNFSITKKENGILLTIRQPYQGASQQAQYLLVPKGEEVPDHEKTVPVIRTPVERVVCTSTTQLPSLEMLGVSPVLKGFPSTQYISSPGLTARVKEGKIKDLGIDSQLNMETLTEIEPDLVFAYTINGNSTDIEQINRLGIPVILHADYLEETPLGRAEWIKFMSAFFDKKALADSIFQKIKSNYLKVSEKVKKVEEKPTAFTGVVYNDVWFMSGGNSWAAKYFKAAGIDYLWKDESTPGSLSLAFEVVYEKAVNADFWIGAAQYKTLGELERADPRYANFNAFRQGNVYGYIKKVNENGGNAYFETGAARPDLVLSDLVKIAHPELLPDYTTYFYQKLED